MVRNFLGAMLLVTLAGCATRSAHAPADLILTGGAIHSARGWVEAVAVRDGVIVSVGTAKTARRLRGPTTHVIELAGATVFPGLYDSHAHPLLAARERFQPCRIPPEPVQAITDALAECVKAVSPGEWISSGPFASSLLESGLNRHVLDAVAPVNPVVLSEAGSHGGVLNSRALEAAGINRSTAAPPGGKIGRDNAGEPDGVLLDAWSLLPASPPPPPDRVAFAAAWALDQLLEVGVTSLTDANAGSIEQRAYVDLADAGQLKPRVRLCRAWNPAMSSTEFPLESDAVRDHLAPSCVKIFVDGASGSGFTAALLEPYLAADGAPTSERGALMLAPEILNAAVTRFDRAGLTVKFHAWGDAAVAAAVTAIEAARSANGTSGPRHEIGHVVLARREDLLRARKANAVLEFSPWIWFPPAGDFMFRNIGAVRMARAWPVRDALDAGASVLGGTDWPAAPGRSPWGAIETLVTRIEPSLIELPLYRFGPPDTDRTRPFAPGQRITLEQAIALFTSNPAMISGQPDAPGIIAPGRKADLIVLDRNPLRIPIAEVHMTTAVMTIVGGQVVFERGKRQ